MNRPTEKLEGLLQAQAMGLTQKHLEKGQQASEQITRDIQAKLRQLVAGEELRFQIEAEQLCRQLLQASRLRTDAELDRLRWTLTQGVLAEVRARLAKLAEDPENHRKVLGRYLAEAAKALPEGTLIAELRPEDIERLRPNWDSLVGQAAPGRRMTLSPLTDHASGGMRVRNEDSSLRVDNTFEGRMARMENEVLAAIMDTLFPAGNNNPDRTS
jgi:V/A-type H+/Na+-transporting ATPase subunit E